MPGLQSNRNNHSATAYRSGIDIPLLGRPTWRACLAPENPPPVVGHPRAGPGRGCRRGANGPFGMMLLIFSNGPLVPRLRQRIRLAVGGGEMSEPTAGSEDRAGSPVEIDGRARHVGGAV